MNILVTGHLGYIGSILVPFLTSQGHQVCGIDSNLYYSSLFGEAPHSIPSAYKDIRDIESSDLFSIDCVIHLAGLSNDPLGDIDAKLTREINYLATVRLAELAKECGVKFFLFASSCSIYGASGSNMIDELSAVNPITSYAHSKYLAEKDLQLMATDSFSPVYFRCATAHGYSPRIRFDLVINNLVAWAHTTGKVLIKSDGTPWRPFVHVEDICRAFIGVMEAPLESVHNQIFNIGVTSENYQVKDVALMVERTVGSCVVAYEKGGGPDIRCYRVSCDKLADGVQAYSPRWTVERSIHDLFLHYQKLGLNKEDFEGPRYNRISLLKDLMRWGQVDATLRWSKL